MKVQDHLLLDRGGDGARTQTQSVIFLHWLPWRWQVTQWLMGNVTIYRPHHLKYFIPVRCTDIPLDSSFPSLFFFFFTVCLFAFLLILCWMYFLFVFVIKKHLYLTRKQSLDRPVRGSSRTDLQHNITLHLQYKKAQSGNRIICLWGSVKLAPVGTYKRWLLAKAAQIFYTKTFFLTLDHLKDATEVKFGVYK